MSKAKADNVAKHIAKVEVQVKAMRKAVLDLESSCKPFRLCEEVANVRKECNKMNILVLKSNQMLRSSIWAETGKRAIRKAKKANKREEGEKGQESVLCEGEERPRRQRKQ